MIKKIILLTFSLLLGNFLLAQSLSSLSLKDAYQKLETRYPTLQNGKVLDQIFEKEIKQLDLLKKPSLFFKADGRFQSESTSLNSDGAMLPFEIDQPLFSVKPYVEGRYQILDGGMNDVQKKLKATHLETEKQNIEVEKFALREQVNQLFLGIILLREQAKLFDISLKDLQNRKEQVSAGVENGIMLESELTKIEVKEIELEANKKNIQFKISGFINTLSYLIDQTIEKDVKLIFPKISERQRPEINRPETTFFKLQREEVLAQTELIDVQKKPQLLAYAQAGIGYPNPVNILDNNIAPFGIIGLNFSWKITDWKKGKVDKEILSLQTIKLHNAENAFYFNLDSKIANYQTNINRLLFQIEQDKKIADLQADILKQLAVQMDEGIITSTEYLTQVNAELISRQNLLIHETELLQTRIEFWSERGGF